MKALVLLFALVASPALADSSPTCRTAEVDFNGNVKIDWECVRRRADEFEKGNWREEQVRALLILKAYDEGRHQ
jgi:hypothetical protein